jgi:hypothetical protein
VSGLDPRLVRTLNRYLTMNNVGAKQSNMVTVSGRRMMSMAEMSTACVRQALRLVATSTGWSLAKRAPEQVVTIWAAEALP